jgi:hypothetical protein
MPINKKKISELPLTQTLVGLYTIGVDALNRSVKVSLEFLKTAADSATSAATAAQQATAAATAATTAANTATSNANSATTNANNATTAANTAAGKATTEAGKATTAATAANNAADNANTKAALADTKAEEAEAATEATQQATAAAEQVTAEMQSLIGTISPTGIDVEYPAVITFRNNVPEKIGYTLTPSVSRRNVLFLGDNNAVKVLPDGTFIVNKPGVSTIHVIPTENTTIYKTIQITVVEPSLRKVGSVLRLMGNGSLRLT